MATTTPQAGSGLPIDDLEPRYGVFGQRERRTVPLKVEQIRAGEQISTNGIPTAFTAEGHAAVYDNWSLDLGGFREKIAPDAFDNALSRNPDVWLLWDHDTRWTLARTANKTLDLQSDAEGLRYFGRVAPTSYASDLRVLMERGDIDQASFAFTVERDEWLITDREDGSTQVERTILEIGELFDVTITAAGAYPQTDTSVVKHIRSRITEEIAEGRLPEAAADALPPTAAPDEPAGEPEPQFDEQVQNLRLY